jgi:hypothetical protein
VTPPATSTLCDRRRRLLLLPAFTIFFHASVEPALWHSRLGHPGDDSLRRIVNSFGFPVANPAPTASSASLHNIFHASVEPALWHSRLGHPGDDSLRRIVNSFGFSCSKSSAGCFFYQPSQYFSCLRRAGTLALSAWPSWRRLT